MATIADIERSGISPGSIPGLSSAAAGGGGGLESVLGSIFAKAGGSTRSRGNTFGVKGSQSRLSGENVRESINAIEDDAGINESDFASIEGRLRQSIEGRAGTEIANLSRRTGGDTSSPLFNLISSTIRGGSIADVSGKLADLRIQNKFQAQSNQFQRSGLLLSLLGLETGNAFTGQQLGLQEQQIRNQFQLGLGQLDLGQGQLNIAGRQLALDEGARKFDLANRAELRGRGTTVFAGI